MTRQAQFEKYHQDNPEVYTKLVELALQLKRAGRDRYAIKQLWGVLRWHHDMNPVDPQSTYKLSDMYYSRYARLIMQNEPELEGFFKLRRLTTV